MTNTEELERELAAAHTKQAAMLKELRENKELIRRLTTAINVLSGRHVALTRDVIVDHIAAAREHDPTLQGQQLMAAVKERLKQSGYKLTGWARLYKSALGNTQPQ